MKATNKNDAGVWIDSQKALIVNLTGANPQLEVIESGVENPVHHKGEGKPGAVMGTHMINNEKTFDARRKSALKKFVSEVAERIKTRDNVYIIGPSLTRNELKKAIEASKNNQVRISKVEASDHLTEKQIIAKVKSHFEIKTK